MEVILTLFGFKVLYPNHFYMSRGKKFETYHTLYVYIIHNI